VYNHTTSTVRTAAEIAADFAALVNLRTANFGMTATVIDSPTTGSTNTAVKLIQNSAGTSGNTNYPSFGKYNSVTAKPYHILFKGGKIASTNSGRSAGDRVAELYATLNNSNNGGLSTIPGTLLTGIGKGMTGDLSGFAPNAADAKYGDYIIGLQIPFTSKINNNSSLFYMPTGAFKDIFDKTADNALPAGTEFDPYDGEYTGIKGAVADATFVQLGGEPIYSFTINFLPIDWII